MRTDHLRYLIEIDKHHSISAAAQELYLGQTTLSAIVKSLEQELGFAIFQRTHNGVQTTPEGEEALSLIWEINCRFEEIKQLGEQASGVSQPVPIITSPTINSALALPINKAFVAEEPAGNLEFHVVAGEEVGSKIIKNDANIGITYFTKENAESYNNIATRYQIVTDMLFQDHLYLLVARDHPLAKRNRIPCHELENLNIAMLPHYNACDGSLAYSKTFGSGNRYTTFSNITLIKQAVLKQGMAAILSGYAIHYNHSVDNQRLKALMLTNTQGENEISIYLIHRADCNLRYQEKVVLQCIKEYFKSLLPPPFSPEFQKDHPV